MQDIVIVDAFSAAPFSGNPAAVCVLAASADESWMRLLAREMNLSETAFVYPIEGGWHLRWFTPKVEADLCGHATLATAHMLFEDGHVPTDRPIRFFTRSGWVSVSREGSWLELDFPINRPEPIDPPPDLLAALGIDAVSYVGHYPSAYLVEVDSDPIVRNLRPDFTALAKLPRPKVCVTAADSSGRADFVSRLFAPAIGVNEDPVNGNSHTALTPYWAAKLGKDRLVAHQASERGGVLKLHLRGERVGIAGQAVIVMRGRLA